MSGNPYEDEPMDPDEANADLLAELKAATSGDGDGEAEEVVIGAPVEDETPEPGESKRDAKRRRRGEEYREQQREKNDEVAELRRELAETRGQITAMESRRVAQQPTETDRRSEFEDRREGVRRNLKENMRDYSAASEAAQREKRVLSEDEKDVFLRRNEKNNKDMNDIDYDEREAAKNTPQTRARAQLLAEYPDVMGNPRSEKYARQLYEQAMERGEGGRDDDALTKKVIDQTRRELKIGNYKNSPEASEKQRSTYGNLRGSGSAAAAKKSTSRVVKDSPEWDMAMAYSEHIPGWTDGQRVQHWVNATKGS